MALRLPRFLPSFGRRSLFGKYATSFVALIMAVLVVSGSIEAWFTYRERKAEFLHTLTEKADAAAERVEEVLAETERHISLAMRTGVLPLEQRRADYALILQHMPAITQIAWFDATGNESLRMTQNSVMLNSAVTRQQAATPHMTPFSGVRYSPLKFTEQGPQIQIAIGREVPDAGVAVADMQLKFLSDILNGIQASPGIDAYIVTPSGQLVADTDPLLARRKPDFSQLPQVAALKVAALATSAAVPATTGLNLDGESVMTAAAPIPKMNWWLFVEAPQSQALAPVYDFLRRLAFLLVLALILAIVAGLALARRMTIPIKAVGTAAARLADGDFSQKIEVRTGDEIEALADEFNRMAAQVENSYERLEQEVDDRTRDLAQSVRELKALEEIGRALAASLDLNDVLATILSRSVDLAGADGGAIYRFDGQRSAFNLAQAHGLDPQFVAAIQEVRIKTPNLLIEAAAGGTPTEVPQIAESPNFPLRGATLRAGFQSALIVPLIGSGELFGTLIVERRRPGRFPANTLGLMQSIAHQAVLAIRNARLFSQVEEKGRQLAIANEHKSLFFASMSHELRTPLNAVLGYAELLQDGLYGDLPERARGVLERVRANGNHLLGLINDVLDISKIEAGELTLTLAEYSLRNVVETVVASTGSLAAAKSLRVDAEIPTDLPPGRGDERRLTQVLLNIVSNAIKFTETGGVTLHVEAANGNFALAIKDTGPGIAPDDQSRIFEAFQQVDNTMTKQKGGTGLGLSISKRFVEMHGGTISVTSTLGQGSTFHILLPIRVDRQSEAA